MSRGLLIVDVQTGFINSHTTHIPNVVRKLQEQYQTLYITRFYNQPGSLFRQLVNWNELEYGTPQWELAFTPADHASIIDKPVYTCVTPYFLQTLTELGIDRLDICGVDTDACVTKCALDLFENHIEPVVLANYCSSTFGYEVHRTALATLKRLIGKRQIIH